MNGTIYLVHFDRPLGHAQHYLGWALDVAAREHLHRIGKGSAILRAANVAGITWRVVRMWEGVDRHFERRLKKRKRAPALCPECKEAARAKNTAQKRASRARRRG